MSTSWVAVDGVVRRSGGQHLVLVDPEGSDPVEAPRIIDERSPVADRPRPGAVPSHAEGPGHRGDAAALFADQAADLLGRPALVSDPSTSSLDSVKVLVGQSGSRQIHRRLRQTSRTGRPAIGRSRTWTSLRPCPTARTPQFAQPTTSAVVSTSSHSSSSTSVAGEDHEALHPQQRGSPTTTVIHAPCPPFLLAWSTARIGGHGALLVDTYERLTGLAPPHASTRRAR